MSEERTDDPFASTFGVTRDIEHAKQVQRVALVVRMLTTRKCPNCKGEGGDREYYDGHMQQWVSCAWCEGTGYVDA